MSVKVRVALALALPVLVYVSTVTLPLDDNSWLGFFNNALWIASALYFVIYLPVKGLDGRNWVVRILLALLAVSILTTSFQGAVKDRKARYEAQKAMKQQQ